MPKMLFLTAILHSLFEIWTFWQPSWIYCLKSGLFGSHLEFTIWKLNFLVWILNGKCKMAAKINIIRHLRFYISVSTIRKPNNKKFGFKYFWFSKGGFSDPQFIKQSRLNAIQNQNKMAAILVSFWMVHLVMWWY